MSGTTLGGGVVDEDVAGQGTDGVDIGSVVKETSDWMVVDGGPDISDTKLYRSRVTEVIRVVGLGFRTRTLTLVRRQAVGWGGVVLFTRKNSVARINSATMIVVLFTTWDARV
jgi:hypothetical protein